MSETSTAQALVEGDRAPDFRLRHTFDEDVGLRDLTRSGPAVVAFYVFDFGSV